MIATTAAALGEHLPTWSALPFAGLLASIAVLPLVAPRLWHRRYPLIALLWSLLFAVPFVALLRGEAVHAILHTLLGEYVPFVILLGALFTISGGIVLRGRLHGTPRTNLALLAAGTALASIIGTTGASMLLIRPLLRANAGRTRRTHIVVFFVFLVSNIGGALTPLGDPPLFLGFLLGVPFFWTLHLLPHMSVLAAFLFAVFWAIERRAYRREGFPTASAAAPPEPLAVAGWGNLALLLGVVAAVLLSGLVDLGTVHLAGVERPREDLVRDAVLVGLAAVSLRRPSRALRVENGFGWGPMREVAILFAAIFVTIVPAIAILNAGEHGGLAPLARAAVAPWHYFWITGALSAVLDNAPTYLTFLATATGHFFEGEAIRAAVPRMVAERGTWLAAISAGAVFMGAMTYIGNAPNFMVRSLAEEGGVAMPSFFGYVLRWSIPILVPGLLLVTVLFFRG